MHRRLFWLLVLAGLAAGCWLGFRALGGDYLRFWLSSGPLIGLGTLAIGFAWGGVDRNAGLVSANPAEYSGAALQLAGLPLYAFGAHLRSRGAPIATLDRLLILPLALLYAAAVIGWLLLIAPAQYFAFLLCGTPSRVALASGAAVSARIENGRLDLSEAEPRPPGYWDATLRERPVSLAAAFLAGIAGLLKLLGLAP